MALGMRIAILTFPLYTNYGGILQAYALQTVLQKMGHKVEFICRRRRMPTPMPTSVRIKRFILKYCLFRELAPLREDVFYARRKIENKYTWKFVDKYLRRREFVGFSDIKSSDYDAIIVGSDQVWRPKYFTDHYNSITNAYLDFTEGWNIKRIAYAVSFGTDDWEYSKEDTLVCKELASKFDTISVREKSGVILCKHYLAIEAKWVLDPTLLLDRDDYLHLISPSKYRMRRGVLCYLLNSTEKTNYLIEYVSKQLELPSFIVNSKVEDSYDENMVYTQPPVECWLQGFSDADFVVTDSFHACVFSIIFEKPFLVFGNKNRGLSRIQSLLTLFGIEDRLLADTVDVRGFDLKSPLHYDKEKKEIMREESFEFLLQSVNY